MFCTPFVALPVNQKGALVNDLQTIHPHIACTALWIACDHLRQGDETSPILRPAMQDGNKI